MPALADDGDYPRRCGSLGRAAGASDGSSSGGGGRGKGSVLGLPRRLGISLLVLLTLVLLGTVAVVGTYFSYFRIDKHAMIYPEELELLQRMRSTPAGAAPAEDAAGSAPAERPAQVTAAAEQGEEEEKELYYLAHVASGPSLSTAPQARLDGEGEAAQEQAADASRIKAMKARPGEKIPRIIHQTWKTDVLPEKWETVRKECQEMHPSYDFLMWTDSDSRKFIAKEYAWFLPTFDSYRYPIERADVIRYFVLYHYGGIYMDLDIGCRKPMDALLPFEVVLPETIPVGVSNDLMIAAPRHPFSLQLVRNLIAFDHSYVTSYATVMFSTGPMFVSINYGLWVDSQGVALSSSAEAPQQGLVGVRVLPKVLYGKNLPAADAKPHAIYEHYYGSSWHANDAGPIIWLRDQGKWLFLVGVLLAACGFARALGLSCVPASVVRVVLAVLSPIGRVARGILALVLPARFRRAGSASAGGGAAAAASSPWRRASLHGKNEDERSLLPQHESSSARYPHHHPYHGEDSEQGGIQRAHLFREWRTPSPTASFDRMFQRQQQQQQQSLPMSVLPEKQQQQQRRYSSSSSSTMLAPHGAGAAASSSETLFASASEKEGAWKHSGGGFESDASTSYQPQHHTYRTSDDSDDATAHDLQAVIARR